MKSSPYRKRYILIYSENLQPKLRRIEEELYRVFRARRKYAEDNYAVFRTNQYYKDQFIEFVRKELAGVETIITSGSMKKCKKTIVDRKSALVVDAKL